MFPSRKQFPLHPEVANSGEIDGNTGIQAAYASAKSKMYNAFGDDRQNNRPTFAFGLEYNRYAKFNNYNEYYLRFQHNNFNVGVQITLPLFDATRKARAQGSSAEAAQATAQADQLRDQTGEQVLRLQKSIAELAAQEQVAELQNELSQDQLDAITTQIRLGSGNPGAAAPLPKDEQGAPHPGAQPLCRHAGNPLPVDEARLSFLRSMGRIEDWAKSSPPPRP